MAQFSAFAPFGLFTFDASPSDAENIYNQIKGDLGTTYDWTVGTYAEARVYAFSVALAYARAIIKRVPAEFHPLTSYDLISTLEKDWACIPGPSDTPLTRQLRVYARKLLMSGSREEAITTDLLAAIGSGFLKLKSMPSGSVLNYPTNPNTVGTFPNPDLPPKFYTLLDAIIKTGSAITIRISAKNGSEAPVVGEKITIEPEITGIAEQITVTAIDGAAATVAAYGGMRLTATFAQAHSIGAWLLTAAPLWISNQRDLHVIVTGATAANPESRRKIHEVMQRHCKTVTRWHICAATSATQVGPWTCGTALVGSTTVGAIATY